MIARLHVNELDEVLLTGMESREAMPPPSTFELYLNKKKKKIAEQNVMAIEYRF